MKRYKLKIDCFILTLILIFTFENLYGQNSFSNYTAAFNAVNSSNNLNSNNSTSLFNNYSPENFNLNASAPSNGYSLANPQNEEFGIDYDVSFRAYWDQMNILLNVSESEIQYMLDYNDYKNNYKKWAMNKARNENFYPQKVLSEYNKLMKLMKTYDQWLAEQTTPEGIKAAQFLLDNTDYKDIHDYAPLDLRMGFKYDPPKALDETQLMFNSVFGYLLLSNYKTFSIKK